jgi:hypothetical protein
MEMTQKYLGYDPRKAMDKLFMTKTRNVTIKFHSHKKSQEPQELASKYIRMRKLKKNYWLMAV